MTATPTLADIDREQIRRRGLAEFVRRAWHLVEPASPLRWNWHLDLICNALERVARRELRDLVVNVPPGMSKSLLVSVLFPAWVWTLQASHAPHLPSMLFGPGHRFIAASYADDVVLRDARKMRTLVLSDWYRARWPGVEIPSDASASKAVGMFATTSGGMRFSTTVRGGVTGQHCDTMIVDDPIDPQGAAAASGVELAAVREWWKGTMSTRFRDHATSARILVMQRVHEDDLADYMLARGAASVCLPMEYDPDHPQRCADDPRTEPGELLCPDRFPREVVDHLRIELGPTNAAAQLDQRPSPKGGDVLRGEWFGRWTELPAKGLWALSIDCTFKKTSDGSFVVIQVWMQVGINHYLVDQRQERMGFVATIKAIKAMIERYPQATLKLIEDKANGTAVIDTLRTEVAGVVEVEPHGGKEARANAVQPVIAAGNVFIPHATEARYPDGRKGAPWAEGFVLECEAFPRGAHDDQVDAMTQYLQHRALKSFTERLRRAVDGTVPASRANTG